MPQGTFSDILIHLRAFETIFVGGPKIDFFPRDKSRFLVKNDQILKSAFVTPLCP